MKWIVALLVAASLAGCASSTIDEPEVIEPTMTRIVTHAVDGLVEPEGFSVPTFSVPVAIAQGGPAYAMGEPGVWAGLDGTIFAAIPGCDNLSLLLPGCDHGMIWKSTDDGATWMRMNEASNGRLTEDGPAANGDADVAVDSAGNVYVSNLGSGIQFHTYWAENDTWEYMANIVPEGEGADRQWLAAAGPGHVINAWMRTSPNRDVEINTTFDGGRTWTGSTYFGEGIGWLGTPQFAADGMTAYIPYTQSTGATADAIAAGAFVDFEMHVIKTTDGGLTWEDIPTGLTWTTAGVNVHWSGGYMAPALDVTGDGTVVVAMAVDNVPGGVAPTSVGTRVVFATSQDNGTTWTNHEFAGKAADAAPDGSGNIVMPWIAGGAGDRFAITYYASPGPVIPDVGGTVWNLEAHFFDFDGGDLRSVHAVIDDDIHEGPLCNRGGSCAFPVDRTLLDYHESDLMPDGRLVVVYGADPVVDNQRNIQVRFAIQDGEPVLGVPQAS